MTRHPPPPPGLIACVVVPARDEEDRIACCIAALAAQDGVRRDQYEVLLVLDACRDRTRERAVAEAARHPGLRMHVMAAGRPGAGNSRRTGMEAACARLEAVGHARGLIASTDADSEPDAAWLRRQLDLVAGGAEAIGGLIEVEPTGLDPAAMDLREGRLRERLAVVRAGAPAEHPFFSGASIGITAEAYRRAGGLRPMAALEDQALERSLADAGVPITRSRAVRVRTSGRTDGRARHGLAADLRADAWTRSRSYRARTFEPGALARAKRGTVSVVLPCREVAGTVGGIVAALRRLREIGLVDEVLAIDAASADGTARVAREAGARVVQESEVLPQFGPCHGKGDAMWRALAVTSGDLVAYVDADTEDFDPAFVTGLLGPLITEPAVSLVKGSFARPMRLGDAIVPGEGGRVTELVARPLLSIVAPELGVFAQPLAGEVAARRPLLEGLAFPVGYGVETAMMIDALRAVGLDGMAQVDLGTRQNRHQPLRELGAMALAVMCAGLGRGLPAEVWEGLAAGRMLVPGDDGAVRPRDVSLEVRPPVASLAGASAAEPLAV